MFNKLIYRLTRKPLMFLVIAIATLSLCLPPSTNAQTALANSPTIWTIQIIGTANPTTAVSKPTYKVTFDPPSGGCPYAHLSTPNAENLLICPADTVRWVAVKSDGSKMTSSEMVIYQQDPILLNENDNPSHGFHASNGDPTTDGQVAPHAEQLKWHKYSVLALDKAALHTYYDDPRIMIGTGELEDILKEISILAEAVLALRPEDPAAKKLFNDVNADVASVKESPKK